MAPVATNLLLYLYLQPHELDGSSTLLRPYVDDDADDDVGRRQRLLAFLFLYMKIRLIECFGT